MKLHLRKYGHTSTANLSLNDMEPGENEVKPKGRRGAKKPRTKTGQRNGDSSAPTSANDNSTTGFNSVPVGSSPSLPIPAFNFPLYPSHPGLAQPTNVVTPPISAEPEKKMREELLKCGMCDYATANKDHFSQHLLAHAAADQHHRELANLFNFIPADLLNSPPNNPPSNQIHHPQQTPLKGSASTPQQHQMKDYFSWMLANPTLLFSTPTAPAVQQTERKKQPEASRTPTPEVSATPPPAGKANQTPLDLSRDKDELPPLVGATNKHRRKGQAFKLERSATTPVTAPPRQSPAHSGTPSPSMPVAAANREAAEEEGQEEEEEEEELEKEIVWNPSPKKETIQKQRNSKCLPGGGEWGGAYQCSYCDIAFKDVVMYTMHMGYHGFQDPFTCNMCGQSTHDKLAFFLHIARSSHS